MIIFCSLTFTTLINPFSVFRCFYVAQSYAGAKKWKEAIGLYARVLEYAESAQKQFKQLPREALYKVKTGE